MNNEFKTYLKNLRLPNGSRLTDRAISTRMSWAEKATTHIGTTLDEAVRTEMSMFKALTTLAAHPEARVAKETNAVRHFWTMRHGTKFPRLQNFGIAA